MDVVWVVYAVGALLALWRTDAHWPTRIALAVLWPLGPLAFVITVGILLAASLIAFPDVRNWNDRAQDDAGKTQLGG